MVSLWRLRNERSFLLQNEKVIGPDRDEGFKNSWAYFLKNKAKRFAKQLASEVYQNKTHSESQICYDKDLLAIISYKIVGP